MARVLGAGRVVNARARGEVVSTWATSSALSPLRSRMRDAVGEELAESGFGANYEPTPRGDLLEGLIDYEGGAGWQVEVFDVVDDLPSFIEIFVGTNWNAAFSTNSLGKPMAPGLYTGVERAEFTDPNVPGLDVTGDGYGCNSVSGQFQVVEITAIPADPEAGVANPTVKSSTATFEQHCEGGPAAAIGCVHVSQ